jgi:hypothetical protein
VRTWQAGGRAARACAQVTGNGGGVSVTGVPGTGWPPAFYYPCNAQGACEWFTPTAVHPAGYAPFAPWTSGNAHPTFERCTFTNNYAAMGAGVYTYEASITMSDCVISGNQASQGGGVYSAPAPCTQRGVDMLRAALQGPAVWFVQECAARLAWCGEPRSCCGPQASTRPGRLTGSM